MIQPSLELDVINFNTEGKSLNHEPNTWIVRALCLFSCRHSYRSINKKKNKKKGVEIDQFFTDAMLKTRGGPLFDRS